MSRKQNTIAIIAMLAIVTLIVSVHQTKIVTPSKTGEAKFAIASWSYPDAYGQGIDGFFIYENSTGGWDLVDGYITHDDPGIFNWTANVAIHLHCYTNFNSTLTGAASTAQGKNYQRHNVTVTNSMSEIVFSKQNFTYYSVDTEYSPIWFYEYYVTLNFLPLAGEYYTVTVTYEVYY